MTASQAHSSEARQSLFALVAEDLRFLGGNGVLRAVRTILFNPSFQLLALHRLSHALHVTGPRWLQPPLKYFQYVWFGCQIAPSAVIGRRCKFAHPLALVVGEGVVIADDCLIYQHVTLGGRGGGAAAAYPTVGNSVTIYAGAVITGGISLGDQSVIAANAVVLTDVPRATTAAGVPARIIDAASRTDSIATTQ